jgi:Zn-dependent protease with chaperone function
MRLPWSSSAGEAAPTYLRASARAREHRHRRALLLGLAAALLLSLAPVVGRHLIGAAHQPLTGIDHVGAVCLVALHLLLAPVHQALHLLLGAGVAYAAWDRLRAWRRARRALAPLDGAAPAVGDAFWTAAESAGLDPARLRVVAGLPSPAFTAGWRSPVVYVARELAEGARRLPAAELAAVIAHERAHVVRRDPLRFSVLRAVAKTLFWIPGLRGLADDVADEAEIRADDAAAAVVGPLTLASALVALGAWRLPAGPFGEPAPDYTVGFAARARVAARGVPFVRHDLLDRRVRRLAGEDTTPASRVTRRSVAGAALALGVVWASGLVDVHDLPHDAVAGGGVDIAHAAHCHHLRTPALSHLFCRIGATGGWITPGGTDCPHRGPPAPPPSAGGV